MVVKIPDINLSLFGVKSTGTLIFKTKMSFHFSENTFVFRVCRSIKKSCWCLWLEAMLAVLLVLFINDVAKCNEYQQRNKGSHRNADPVDLFVDVLIRFPVLGYGSRIRVNDFVSSRHDEKKLKGSLNANSLSLVSACNPFFGLYLIHPSHSKQKTNKVKV